MTTAFTVIVYFSGNIDTISGITETEISEQELQLAENHCDRERAQMCSGDEYDEGATGWAADASYDGRTCNDWAGRGAWGGEVPGCDG